MCCKQLEYNGESDTDDEEFLTEELGTISPPILKLQSEEGTRCGRPCFSLLSCVSNLKYSVSSTANSENKVTIIIYKSDITTVYKAQPRIKSQSERERSIRRRAG